MAIEAGSFIGTGIGSLAGREVGGKAVGIDAPITLSVPMAGIYSEGYGSDLTADQCEVIDILRGMGEVPFINDIPFDLPPQAKKDVAKHELGHVYAAEKYGAQVLAVSVDTQPPVSGVTLLAGIHSPDQMLPIAAAGAAAAGPEGLAGDKAVVADIARQRGQDADTLFSHHEQQVKSSLFSDAQENEIMDISSNMLAYLKNVTYPDIENLRRRAKIEIMIKQSGLTVEQVLLHLSPQRLQEAEEKRIKAQEEWWQKYDAVPETTTIALGPEGEVWTGEVNGEIVAEEVRCPDCHLSLDACQCPPVETKNAPERQGAPANPLPDDKKRRANGLLLEEDDEEDD